MRYPKNIAVLSGPKRKNVITDDVCILQCVVNRMEERKIRKRKRRICFGYFKDIRFEVAVDGRRLTKQAVSAFSTTRRVEDIIHNRWDNLVMVRIYFKTIERKIYEHVPKYDIQELFSHLGGYSGVWLGFSLLNLYELLEIIVATLNFAKSKMLKAHQPKRPPLPPVFYTQSSKKFYEDNIVTNSLFFSRKKGTLGKLKTKNI
ncbi:uncharacterized protein TNCT_334101 [Trichonephila clavata]|uniref:Uncharacterized protein n=1 Tax=Trichonephila clavata TaxID=2740835 RepID=A0A8X6IBD2_TRICU|nr:uncharacterized protein TNCT_334101 [Trichonephila clavata]